MVCGQADGTHMKYASRNEDHLYVIRLCDKYFKFYNALNIYGPI